jgi:hypothetical protein
MFLFMKKNTKFSFLTWQEQGRTTEHSDEKSEKIQDKALFHKKLFTYLFC